MERQLGSWIEGFQHFVSDVEAPAIFKKWMGIATIGAVMEQKTWMMTHSKIHPNLYTFFVGPPGAGKTQIMNKSRELMAELPDPLIAPTSMTVASLIDHLAESKRMKMNPPGAALQYNTTTIMVGELGTFVSKYEDDMIAMLADLYDVTPYYQRRRGSNLKVKIEKPQVNMMIGVTPSILMKTLPDTAWDQGFTSRVLFVYGDDKHMVDDFAKKAERSSEVLIHDLRIMNEIVGQFRISEDYRNAVLDWRNNGEEPRPTHPRLTHYCSRRKAHLYRLSMIAALDRSNVLYLSHADFVTALDWMTELEETMPRIFASPTDSSDLRAIEEIEHFILDKNLKTKRAVPEYEIVGFARERVRAQDIPRIIQIIVGTKKVVVKADRMGIRYFQYNPSSSAVAAIEAEEVPHELRPLKD